MAQSWSHPSEQNPSSFKWILWGSGCLARWPSRPLKIQYVRCSGVVRYQVIVDEIGYLLWASGRRGNRGFWELADIFGNAVVANH